MSDISTGMLVRILREFLATIKALKGCKYCPERHPGCLDFHHREPESKTFNISQLAQRGSWRQIEQELEKCDVVCSNCHRRLHYDERLAASVTGRTGNPILLVLPPAKPRGRPAHDRMAQMLSAHGPQTVGAIATNLKVKPNAIRAMLHKHRALFGRDVENRSLIYLKQQG